jgi:prepilin-type N-terminal cleavage/methylation domain-containing protein
MKTLKNTIKRGFTLIELLVVISIIGIIAAFAIPTIGACMRYAKVSNVKLQMASIESDINSYFLKNNIYPPSGTNAYINPLYVELNGTYYTNGEYRLLFNNSVVTPINNGVPKFYNSSHGDLEDGFNAVNYLGSIKPNLIEKVTNEDYYILRSGIVGNETNPFCYRNPSTHLGNEKSYDLWIDLKIGNDTYRLCTWDKRVEKNPTDTP